MAKGISPAYREDDWQTENDLRTLCDAEAIKKDPKRMKKCQEMAKKKMMDMASVAHEGMEK